MIARNLTTSILMKSGLSLAILLSSSFSYASIEIAITVDDLPASGTRVDPKLWKKASDRMLAAFKKHGVHGVYGFVNSKPIEQQPVLSEILFGWVGAGHFLGNHTFSHADLAEMPATDYSKEISSNEHVLKKFMGSRNYKYFRFPYLAEGETLEKRDKVRSILAQLKYQTAPVTLDFFDYEWAEPYVRCRDKRNDLAMKWLQTSYVEQALNGMEIAQLTSKLLFGRDIKYVMLIHIGIIQSEVLDTLLSALESKGAKFISLAEALSDEIYQIDPKVARKRSYTLLNQIRISRSMQNPERVTELFDSLPEGKLSELCK